MPDRLITLSDPRAPAAEAYRTLRTNLIFSNVDAHLNTIAITSPSQGEGKSVTLANLAVVLAQSEHQTLIVDADLRRPTQHELWGVDNDEGLTSMLLDERALQSPAIHSTDVEGLGLLTSGPLPANPADVLASQKMDAVIARLSEMADFILFDVPPVLAVSDAAILGRRLAGVLLVVKAGTTRRDPTARARDQLQRVGANLIGAVLTNAPRNTRAYYG
jgi:non-specific protein-tyrosine kinase